MMDYILCASTGREDEHCNVSEAVAHCSYEEFLCLECPFHPRIPPFKVYSTCFEYDILCRIRTVFYS